MEYLVTLNAGIALLVGAFALAVSLRLKGIDNIQARDVRWFCTCLAIILTISPIRYFAKVNGYDIDFLNIIMVPAMLAVLWAIYRMYNHLMEP